MSVLSSLAIISVIAEENFDWIYPETNQEVEKCKTEPCQVGKMGDTTAVAENLGKDFDCRIADHKVSSLYRKYSHDINSGIRKKCCESKQNGIYRAGCPEEPYLIGTGKPVNQKREGAGAYSSYQVKKEKLAAAHFSFYLDAEEEKRQHVEEDVRKTGVGEHVGDNLPVELIADKQNRIESQICPAVWNRHIYQEYDHIDDNYCEGCVEMTIDKRSVEGRIIHSYKSTGFFLKGQLFCTSIFLHKENLMGRKCAIFGYTSRNKLQ